MDELVKTRELFILALAAFFGLTVESACAQRPKGNLQDEAALLKCAEAFLEAFHKGNAKALAPPKGVKELTSSNNHLKGDAKCGRARIFWQWRSGSPH